MAGLRVVSGPISRAGGAGLSSAASRPISTAGRGDLETRLTHDPEVDALHLKLGTAEITETEEVAPNVMLDLDGTGNVVGIEVLGVSLREGADPLRLDFAVLAEDRAAALEALAGWRDRAREAAADARAAEEGYGRS